MPFSGQLVRGPALPSGDCARRGFVGIDSLVARDASGTRSQRAWDTDGRPRDFVADAKLGADASRACLGGQRQGARACCGAEYASWGRDRASLISRATLPDTRDVPAAVISPAARRAIRSRTNAWP